MLWEYCLAWRDFAPIANVGRGRKREGLIRP
jgi:hypothetical protein